MRIYLVRHGKASKDTSIPTDAERPLTGRGRSDVDQLARWMAASGAEVQQIRHSGLLRARQTAEIFGQHLKPAGGVIAVEGLTYEDPVEPVAESLVLEMESLMFVGHNPFMEQLTGLLLTGDVSRTPVSFGTSSTVCLERIEGVWVLKWALHRELIPGGEKE